MIKTIITHVAKHHPDIIPYLTGRARVLARKTADAPDDAQRRQMEAQVAAIMEKFYADILAELETLASNNRLPAGDFWQQAQADLYGDLLPAMTDAASNGVTNAISAGDFFGVSWNIVNNDAIQWAQQNTAEVVASISKTSMTAFQDKFGEWVESGQPLDKLIESLEPYYGEVKAGQVAVTETTRAYAAGNLAVWRNSGVVSQFNVFTAEDDIVCPICTRQEAENPHNINADPPPYHVNCRCWIQPIVKDEE